MNEDRQPGHLIAMITIRVYRDGDVVRYVEDGDQREGEGDAVDHALAYLGHTAAGRRVKRGTVPAPAEPERLTRAAADPGPSMVDKHQLSVWGSGGAYSVTVQTGQRPQEF